MRVYQKHAGDDAKLLIKFHWPYSAHTKVHEYPRFAPEVLKHSFSLEDPVLLSRYSSVVLTSKFSRLFLGWRLAYYWYRCFPYKRYLCQKQPSCKKGEAKNAQVHVHGVTKRHDIKSGQESIYSIGTFVHSFSICFTLSHPTSCTCVLAISILY